MTRNRTARSATGAPRGSRWKNALALGIVLGLFAFAEWALGLYYYGQSYSHYAVGQVYWEDSNTELFFSPDRHLFWRYKPNIRIELANPIEEYGLYRVGTRSVPHRIVVETDESGFRGPGFDCEKEPGTYRIFVLGDSRSMAEGVDVSERYSEVLEQLLDAREDGRDYEVINAATDGYSSYQGRVLLERELLACEPDAVTVLFGINDQDWDQNVRDVEKAEAFDNPLVEISQLANRSMLVYFARRQARQLRAFLFGGTLRRPTYESSSAGRTRRVPLEDYRANHRAVAELGAEHGFTPVFVLVPNSPYARYPELFLDRPWQVPPRDAALVIQAERDRDNENFSAAADLLERFVERHPERSGERFRLAQTYQELGRFEDAHREFLRAGSQIVFTGYEDTLRESAAANGVLLADLAPEFLRARRESLYIDDLHPDARGQRLIAEEIYHQLTPLLDAEGPAGGAQKSE